MLITKMSYDSKFDVLYISLANGENSIGCEEYGGLVVMRDLDSDEITGLILYDFIDKYRRNAIPEMPEGIQINFDQEVLPNIAGAK